MGRKLACSLLLLGACWALGVAAQGGRPGSSPGRPDILLSSRPGCGPALKANLQDCAIDEMMGSNATMTVGFTVDAKAAKQFSLLLTLRSTGGAAVIRVYPSSMGMYSGRVVYFNDAVTESILRIPAPDLEAGDYTIVVQGMGGATQKLLLYLRVQTPAANVKLNADEKDALKAIWRACCPVTKGLEAPDVCATFLPNVFKATKPEDDICNTMGFVCNTKGQLQKIDFSNAGLKCKRFPSEFGQFPELETLMLRFNSFGEDSFENVAEVLSNSSQLRRLMLGNTNITGTIPCRLFEEHSISTLMFSVNKLEGSLPDCVLAHAPLTELYMSRLPLTGALPDSIPEDSKLEVWYAINRDPLTGKPSGPGFSGKLPRSIEKASNLKFAELSGHQMSGGIPTLPGDLRMFEVQNNQLSGGVSSPLPSSLIYFDASNNSLVGELPDFTGAENLTLIDLSQNQLTGKLPTSFGPASNNLVYMDLSRNKLGGNINERGAWERMPALQYLFLQANSFEGSVPASLAANKKLVALNMAFNRLDGTLEDFATTLPPPRKTSPQQDPDSAVPDSSQAGRKLLAGAGPSFPSHRNTEAAAAAAVDPVAASLALGKKLLGTREDWSILQPHTELQQLFTLDTEAIGALATGHAHEAGRRLLQQQDVTSTPAPGGATTSTVTRPSGASATAPEPDTTTTTTAAAAPAAATTPDTPDAPDAPASSSSSPSSSSSSSTAVEPTPPAPSSSSSGSSPAASSSPSSSSSSGPSGTAGVTAFGAPRGRPIPDMGYIAPPTRSMLAGNSFLYLNLSNNDIEGPVPEAMGNLEMFRSPANSSDPFDMYVYSRGGPDRTLDLTQNQLYGEFPRFLVNQAADLSDSCLCSTNFTVSDGNQLYCPTKSALQGVKLTPNLMDTLKQAGYTCLLPNQKTPVALDSYLANPAGFLTQVPAQAELAKPEEKPKAYDAATGTYAPRSSGRSSGGGKSGMGPGEIAGLVIGLVAGLGILGALAYFVGYKRFYQTHQATSFKRSEIPEGPMLDGAAPYPAAAYGGGNTNGSHYNPDNLPVSGGAPRV